LRITQYSSVTNRPSALFQSEKYSSAVSSHAHGLAMNALTSRKRWWNDPERPCGPSPAFEAASEKARGG
jgi:hypothetical protein